MPLIPRATRGLQWYGQWVATLKREANLETISQLGLSAVTRRHERGIPSNRVHHRTVNTSLLLAHIARRSIRVLYS